MKLPKRPTIAFLTNIVTAYRVSFFEKLCMHQEFEWVILHGREDEAGRPAHHGAMNIPSVTVVNYGWKLGPFSIRWQKKAFTQLRRLNPDWIILLGQFGTLSNWGILLWSTLRRKKKIVWYSGWEAQAKKRKVLAFKQFLMRFYLALADHILVYSSKGKQYITQLGIPNDKVTVCYNGIEIDSLLEKESMIKEEGRNLRKTKDLDSKKLFLYVGGMLEEKRGDLLLAAFSELLKEEPSCHLWLVGDGPARTDLESYAQTICKDSVTFWGRVDEGVDRFFAAADFFVLPGVGGLALNQALFWRLPCIVSEADGTEDDLVIHEETGFRFQAGDANSVLTQMRACLQLSEDERICMGERGRQFIVNRSNVSQMLTIFIDTIHRLNDIQNDPG